MQNHRIEGNLVFPTEKFRQQIRSAAKERGFRSEQAFIPAACENELKRGDSTEATAQLEARIAATPANTAKQVQSLFTLVQAQIPSALAAVKG
jgi:hypothetical protein